LGQVPEPSHLIWLPQYDHVITDVEAGFGRRVENELMRLVDLFPHRDDDKSSFLGDACLDERLSR
jgi:hypothetical protein